MLDKIRISEWKKASSCIVYKKEEYVRGGGKHQQIRDTHTYIFRVNEKHIIMIEREQVEEGTLCVSKNNFQQFSFTLHIVVCTIVRKTLFSNSWFIYFYGASLFIPNICNLFLWFSFHRKRFFFAISFLRLDFLFHRRRQPAYLTAFTLSPSLCRFAVLYLQFIVIETAI